MKKLLLLLLFAGGSVFGQTYPAKPVKLIVSYPPGGSSDLMARVFGAKLAEMWGQQVVVENKPGAAGSIGTDYAAKQPPDGYSFMIANLGPIAVNPLLSNVPYNVEKDFAPVSLISTGPNVLVVRSDAEFRSLGEIVAHARANPGKLNYGTSGPGSVSHLSSEMLKNITRVQAVEVPYKGGVLAVQDLLGGQIQFIFSDSLPAMQHIRAGKLRALATNASRRIPELPEVPTVRELGFPGLEADGWNGLFAPAKTPREVIDRLQKETVAAVRHPETAKRLMEIGAQPAGSTPAEQDAILKRQVAQFRPIIREMRIEN